MATAPETLQPAILLPTEFSRIVARHIRSLLREKGLLDRDLGPMVGLTPPQVSERLGGKTAWKAYELDAVAVALEVTLDVLTARNETSFREKLTSARLSHDPRQGTLALAWSQDETDHRFSPSKSPPLLHVVPSHDHPE